MAFEYFRHGPFLDVPDPENPPVGAVAVQAAALNAMEDALAKAAAESSTYASRPVEDPDRPGIYIMEAS